MTLRFRRMWCDKCFCLDFRLCGVPSGAVLGLVGRDATARVADSNAIAARTALRSGPGYPSYEAPRLGQAILRRGRPQKKSGLPSRSASRSWPARRASSRRSSFSRTSSRRSSSTSRSSRGARPLLPVPPPCKRRPLPRQRRLRNCTRLRGWIPERCAGTNEWTRGPACPCSRRRPPRLKHASVYTAASCVRRCTGELVPAQ